LKRYTLIITEKPDAANRIAMALDNSSKPEKIIDSGVPYYKADRNGEIIVVPALGHLYTVASKEKNRNCPVFDYQWVPRYLAERNASRIRTWLKVIAKLAEDAEEFVDACDFDMEGSIIGYSILKYACGGKDETAKRMKYSTLTKEELQQSYAHLSAHLDFALIEAGLTRHEVDWLYGINLSRALTTAAKNVSRQYTTLSTGRVQGPTLRFLELREKDVRSFVPTPYWTITAKIEINGVTYEAEYERIIQNKNEATSIVKECKTDEGQIESVETKKFEEKPPLPFDLGALQSEAYKFFRYTPIRSSNIAQHLYLEALISYPRTSSQKLPAAIGYETILRKLSKMSIFTKNATKLLSKTILKPREGERTDPAHPAIYPTGEMPKKISIPEKNIFDLVVRRFMAVFGEPATFQSIKISLDIGGNRFLLSGIRTLDEGWLDFYKPYITIKESDLPPLIEGQKILAKQVTVRSNFTKPPARYNPRSLLLKMEKEEIGTKATRAAIIQTLLNRKYIQGSDSFVVCDLGFEVTEILSKYCSTVVSPELTRKLEEAMDEIRQGKETRESVLLDVIEILKPVISELKQKESVIGNRLNETLKKSRLEERIVGACPKCAYGKLIMLRSRKTGKRFVGCTNYFEQKCNVTFPLPQNGKIKPCSTVCKSCGSPMVYALMKGKKPWKLCLNPSCTSKRSG